MRNAAIALLEEAAARRVAVAWVSMKRTGDVITDMCELGRASSVGPREAWRIKESLVRCGVITQDGDIDRGAEGYITQVALKKATKLPKVEK